jgi:hypothetical protein
LAASWRQVREPLALDGIDPPIQTDGTTLYLVDTAHGTLTGNTFWVSTDDGATLAERHLPTAADGFLGPIDMTGPGQYVTLDRGRTAFYRSTDGLNWTHVTIR